MKVSVKLSPLVGVGFVGMPTNPYASEETGEMIVVGGKRLLVPDSSDQI